MHVGRCLQTIAAALLPLATVVATAKRSAPGDAATLRALTVKFLRPAVSIGDPKIARELIKG